MIPMKMGQEHVDGQPAILEFIEERLPEAPHTGAAVKDQHFIVVRAHFDARRIPAISEILNFRCGGGTANSPELDPHAVVCLQASTVNADKRDFTPRGGDPT